MSIVNTLKGTFFSIFDSQIVQATDLGWRSCLIITFQSQYHLDTTSGQYLIRDHPF